MPFLVKVLKYSRGIQSSKVSPDDAPIVRTYKTDKRALLCPVCTRNLKLKLKLKLKLRLWYKDRSGQTYGLLVMKAGEPA